MSSSTIVAQAVLLNPDNWSTTNIKTSSNSEIHPTKFLKNPRQQIKLNNTYDVSDKLDVSPYDLVYDDSTKVYTEVKKTSPDAKIILSQNTYDDEQTTYPTGQYHLNQPMRKLKDLSTIENSIRTHTCSVTSIYNSNDAVYDAIVLERKSTDKSDIRLNCQKVYNQSTITGLWRDDNDLRSKSYRQMRSELENIGYTQNFKHVHQNPEEITSIVIHPPSPTNGQLVRADQTRHDFYKIEIITTFGVQMYGTRVRKVPVDSYILGDFCRFDYQRTLTILTPRVYHVDYQGNLVLNGPQLDVDGASYKHARFGRELGNRDDGKFIPKTKGTVDKPKQTVQLKQSKRVKMLKTEKKCWSKQISEEALVY